MTTAREQAINAAHDTIDPWAEDQMYNPTRCADVASDVWEPYLRDLLYLIPYAASVEAITQSEAFARAREALG